MKRFYIGLKLHLSTVTTNCYRSFIPYLFLLCLGILLPSCESEPDESYGFSAENLCVCYSEKVFTEIDQRLSRCLDGFHKVIDEKLELGYISHEEVQEIKKFGVQHISLWLSSRCLSYRESLMTVLEERLQSHDPEQARDSIKKYEGYKIKELPLSWDLLEYYLSASEWLEAEQLLKRLLEANPSSDYGFWIQSYFNHRRKDYQAARSSIDKALANAKEEEFKYILQLYKNTYGPIDRSNDYEIRLNFDYEDQ